MIRAMAGGSVLVASLAFSAPPDTRSEANHDRLPRPTAKTDTITLVGSVLPFAEAVRPLGLVYDAEPVAKPVVLQGDDGSITPFFSDDASRALFQDERLQHRRTKLTARKYADLPYVQIVDFQVEDQGRFRTPEYFCEICTISVRYPQICPCCQGDMVLRMRPDR
jgi:hypothetical protein